MAAKLDYIHKEVAGNVGNTIASATDDGKNFDKSTREKKILEARRALYLDAYLNHGPVEFGDMFPEYKTTSLFSVENGTVSLVKTGLYKILFTFPDNIKFIYSAQFQFSTGVLKKCEKVSFAYIPDLENNNYTLYKPTADIFKYCHYENKLVVYSVTGTLDPSDAIKLFVLIMPNSAAVAGGTEDIIEKDIWQNHIITKASEIIKSGVQEA